MCRIDIRKTIWKLLAMNFHALIHKMVICIHRGSMIEIVKRLFTPALMLTAEFLSIAIRPPTKAGFLGVGRGACSLLIIKTTSCMAGRSVGFSWTQRSPTLTSLNRIEMEGGYPIIKSIKSNVWSVVHNSQACYNFKIISTQLIYKAIRIWEGRKVTHIIKKIEWLAVIEASILLATHNL